MYYIILAIFLLFVHSASALDKDLKKKHMESIALVESSGGKNTNHSPVNNSLHKGDRAYGRYGLMPNTIKLIVKRDKKLIRKYANLLKLNGKQIHIYLKNNASVEHELAGSLYDYYAKKYDQRLEYITCAWHYGEGKINKISVDELTKLSYTKKVFAFYEE